MTKDIALGVQYLSRRVSIFDGIPEGDLACVRARGVPMEFRRGQEIFIQNSRHSGIFLIEDGTVKVFYQDTSGREITLAYWGSGNFVGGPDIFGGSTHLWSGTAHDQVYCLFFDGETVKELVKAVPSFAVSVIEALSYKARIYSVFAQILGTRSARGRMELLVSHLIQAHSVRTPHGILLPPITHDEIANLIGATRQWVSSVINELREKKVVSVRNGRIIVHRKEVFDIRA